MHVSELLASLEAPVYIERVALGNNKQVMNSAPAQLAGRRPQTKR
jgi:2-oxoisovalerate ferredoxin oxidoreductase beta subunit